MPGIDDHWSLITDRPPKSRMGQRGQQKPKPPRAPPKPRLRSKPRTLSGPRELSKPRESGSLELIRSYGYSIFFDEVKKVHRIMQRGLELGIVENRGHRIRIVYFPYDIRQVKAAMKLADLLEEKMVRYSENTPADRALRQARAIESAIY